MSCDTTSLNSSTYYSADSSDDFYMCLSSDSDKSPDNNYTNGIGDIIIYYDETRVRGTPDSQIHAAVTFITDAENGYIRTQKPYSFNGDSLIKIKEQRGVSGEYEKFTDPQWYQLKTYNFKVPTAEEYEKWKTEIVSIQKKKISKSRHSTTIIK